MALNSHKSIPIRIAVIVAFIVSILSAVFLWIQDGVVNWFLSIIIFLAILISAWFVSSYHLEKFLYRKVKLIYKTIHNFKRASKKMDSSSKEDLLEEVSKDVQVWASDKLGRIEQLQSQENFRREFIGNLSHELKTPVFNIQGFILTLLDGALDDPEHNKLFLKKAAKSADRITALLDDLDSISRIEEGVLKLNTEKFDIVDLASEVIEFLEVKAQENNITLKLRNQNQKSEYVRADREKIAQVFTNLLVNSIKYGSPDGTTEIRFYDMDENILIEVKDNGMGIEEMHLPRLFERFYRIDKSRSRHIGGTGLGLAIVKHILEAHDHNISVSSQHGKGSTFSFTLTKA